MPETGVWCFIVCFGFMEPAKPKIVDAYCQTYIQVIRTAGEIEHVKGLPRAIRDKIQGNDLEYLCRCKGSGIKACQRVKKQ